MPVGSHITELLRQAVIASLSGGFSYEPENSLFCNTVHLYVYGALLLVPLLLGILTGGSTSLTLCIGYIGFVIVLFTIFKVGVTYLHSIFDQTEPMVKSKAATAETFRSPVSSFSTTRRETSNVDGTIEMSELNVLGNRLGSEEAEVIIEPPHSTDSSSDSSSDHSNYSAGSGESSANELLTMSHTPARTVLPADSLELIADTYRRSSECEAGRGGLAAFARKHSHPNLALITRTGERRPTRVRKVRSTTDAALAIASQHRNSLLVNSDLAVGNSRSTQSSSRRTITKEPTDYNDKKFDVNLRIHDEEKPNDIEDLIDDENKIDQMRKTVELDDKPCCSKTLDQPDVSDLESDEPTISKVPAAVLHRTLDRLGADADNLPEIDASDLKGQITKFLEELIDKHPECALDAIESVALRRLGRSTLGRGSFAGARYDEDRDRPYEPQEAALSLYRSFRDDDSTHVAYCHEDTTEGAIHSFQDEKGNWWAYAFDGRSSGTAQALGSIAQAIIDHSESIDECERPPIFAKTLNSGKSRSRSNFRHCRSLSSTNRATDGRRHQRLPTVPSDSPLDAIDSKVNSLSDSGESFEHADADSESRYIPHAPSSVFRPQSSSEGSSSRPFISFVNLASRIYSSQLQRNAALVARRPDGGRSRLSIPITADSSLVDAPPTRQRTALERIALQRTTVPGQSTGSYSSMNFIEELRQLYAPVRQRVARQPPSKLDYYYRLKLLPRWVPFGSSGFKIKLNRLSLNRLFDRNHSWASSFFDVWLAAVVSILASVIIARGVFTDFSLLVFAFVVAGSQFSLLKSVQPDAASPVSIGSSRPVYFCLSALLVLGLEIKLTSMGSQYASPTSLTSNGFVWNPHRGPITGGMENIIVGVRDLSALGLLLLPIAFTIGLLPQVNTLAMHICEQLEMHVFGGTATFSPLSALIAVLRSTVVVGLLGALAHGVRTMSPESTQSVVFSAFASVLTSAAYLMSRWSSNPQHIRIALKQLFTWRRTEDVRSSATSRVTYHVKSDNGASQQNVVLELGPHQQESNDQKARSSSETTNLKDPLPEMIRRTLSRRMHHDIFYIFINLLFVFALHSTSVFTTCQPYFEFVLTIRGSFLRSPVLRPYEFYQFETTIQARLMGFEQVHVWMRLVEKSVAWPLLVLSLLTSYAWQFSFVPSVLTALCAFRLLRGAYATPQMMWIPLGISFVVCKWIFGNLNLDLEKEKPTLLPLERFGLQNLSPLVVLYVAVLVWPKIRELELKVNFILVYIAPWQISWGSAWHAFAQPFSVPHSGLLCAQALISSIISSPLNPVLGSSFFLLSYVRPLRFWEKHYNTKSVDSNLRLSSMLEKGPLIDDSSLNSIFYEHLTRSLQQSLAGDLTLGRWGCNVEPGDCFILVSLYLSCLVHIIEVGNGFVTFQLRGLEFRGTYCHQREAEAIGEDQHTADTNGCCCCSFGVIPGFLSYNTAFSLRWLAWEVTTGKYIIDGYSITDNSAVNLLQVHELRRLLVSFYVKCIIWFLLLTRILTDYALKSSALESWLTNEVILQALDPIRRNPRYIESDQIFCAANDEDYDVRLMALSRQRFFEHYGGWINYCMNQRLATNSSTSERLNGIASNNLLNSFCFALSILGRRALGSAAYNRHANAAESFLYGLHSLFKGDMRIGSIGDEWVFTDPSILTSVISPAVRMALKLHQDHFAAMDDFEDLSLLYQRIQYYQTNIFISHEHDPAWRNAIIANTPSLLALRHMYDESQDDYKVIMLNRMHLNMRVIKLNRECVRSFWSGQQQELIFLRNRNPERGSIQNARQVLRNMINSSADQPIGYPIYVSPLTTSFVETHDQVNTGRFTFYSMYTQARRLFCRLRRHFGTSTSSNLAAGMTISSNVPEGMVPLPTFSPIGPAMSQAGSTPVPRRRTTTSSAQSLSGRNYTLIETAISRDNEDDNVSHTHSLGTTDHPTDAVHRRCKSDAGNTSALLRTLAQTHPDRIIQPLVEMKSQTQSKVQAEIINKSMVQTRLNEPQRSTGEFLVSWPSSLWRERGGQSVWHEFQPFNGLTGEIVHHWHPCHRLRQFRSFAGLNIFLIHYNDNKSDYYIPILKEGIRILNSTENEQQETETNL
ncbi:Pecanex-like protein [Aphelenchoides besseyi]|nr:Pecanex-like protein [Aphelenchoides besseyi]